VIKLDSETFKPCVFKDFEVRPYIGGRRGIVFNDITGNVNAGSCVGAVYQSYFLAIFRKPKNLVVIL
jgi:hypothetical protein